MRGLQLNLDGLVGPTHNFGGVAAGNLASAGSLGCVSRPRAAALEGLAKMRRLAALGVPQALVPPHPRPQLGLARQLGFGGSDAAVLSALARHEPQLLAACYSAAPMWTANAATVSPSADCADGRVHFTPANLQAQLHRSLEAPQTQAILQAIFASEDHFAHHPPLPSAGTLGDEGAANHCRFAPDHGGPGLELFVYGRVASQPWRSGPRRFCARQTEEASRSVARRHGVFPDRLMFGQQDPSVIDQGVFHNDLIAVSDLDCLLVHERAFADPELRYHLQERYRQSFGAPLDVLLVREHQVSVEEAVRSYLFNAQLVHRGRRRCLICPDACAHSVSVRALLDGYLAERRLDEVHYLSLDESMRGGGGPACLRLRVALRDAELAAMNPAVRLDEARFAALERWVMRHYRPRLTPQELADPALISESQTALDELSQLLQLGSIYPFQRAGVAA